MLISSDISVHAYLLTQQLRGDIGWFAAPGPESAQVLRQGEQIRHLAEMNRQLHAKCFDVLKRADAVLVRARDVLNRSGLQRLARRLREPDDHLAACDCRSLRQNCRPPSIG